MQNFILNIIIFQNHTKMWDLCLVSSSISLFEDIFEFFGRLVYPVNRIYHL